MNIIKEVEVKDTNIEPKPKLHITGIYEEDTIRILIGDKWVDVNKEEFAGAVFLLRGKWG